MKKAFYGPLFCLLLAGCSMVPEFHLPDADAPSIWKNGATATAGKEQPVAPDWWRNFNSEELNQFMNEALAQNNDIRAAIARIEQARANAQIAGAPLLPSVSATAGASKSRAATGGKTTSSSSGNAGLNIAYELDLFGANRAAAESASAAVTGSIYDQQALALTTMSDVANGYFQVLNLRERVRIAQQNLKTGQDVLRIVTARFNAGASSALDVSQQKTVLASSQASLSTLESQEAQAEDALAVLLAKAPRELSVDAQTLEGLSIPDIAPAQPSALLERRPDIRSAEAALVAANADIGAARAAFFPTINLSAGLSLAASPISSPVTTAISAASALLAPIFSGGSLEGQLALSRARQAELVENYRKAVYISFQEVEDALAAVKAAGERETSLKEAVDQAMKSYTLSRGLYQSGGTDFQTFLNAQASMLQAEDSYAAVRLEALEAAVDLYKALGGGWHSDQPVAVAPEVKPDAPVAKYGPPAPPVKTIAPSMPDTSPAPPAKPAAPKKAPVVKATVVPPAIDHKNIVPEIPEDDNAPPKGI